MTLAESAELARSLDPTPDDLARALNDLSMGVLLSGVPATVYHAPVLGIASKSGLDQILDSPAHYRAWLAGLRDRSSPAFAFGTAVHMGILEPELFKVSYAIAPPWGDCRKTANKAARDKWRGEHPNWKWLESAEGAALAGMVRRIESHSIAREFFVEGLSEVTALWEDRRTGIKCKMRVDHFARSLRVAIDIKTTTKATPEHFARDLDAYGYHRQAAHYLDGLNAAGEEVDEFLFLAIEKTPPHELRLFQVDEDDVARGREENERAISTLAQCLELDQWPGYEEEIVRVSLPPWSKSKKRRAA